MKTQNEIEPASAAETKIVSPLAPGVPNEHLVQYLEREWLLIMKLLKAVDESIDWLSTQDKKSVIVDIARAFVMVSGLGRTLASIEGASGGVDGDQVAKFAQQFEKAVIRIYGKQNNPEATVAA